MLKKLAATAMGALLCVSLFTGAVPHSAIASQKQAAASQVVQTTDDKEAYLFVHFKDDDNHIGPDSEQIYFSVSKNGTSWKTLNNVQPVLRNTVGDQGVRDPHIIRSPETYSDGTPFTGKKFYLIGTDLSIHNTHGDWGRAQSNASKDIVVWESDNLTDWTFKGAKTVAPQNAAFAWAPESFWDEEKDAFMVFWASRTQETSDDWTFRIWRSYTTDFETFTDPEVYIDTEYNERRIDTTIFKEGDTYYRFTKNELTKKVYMEKAKSLSGDFEIVSTFTLNGAHYTSQDKAYEGATMYKLNGEDKWCLLLDSYDYKPFVTDDLSKGRFVSARAFNFGGEVFRHGSVLPITGAEYEGLIEAYADGNDPIENDVVTGDLVYSLDFENNLNAGKGTVKTAATKLGSETDDSVNYVDGVNGGKAIRLSSKNYVQLPGAALAGAKAATVTFAAKVHDSNTTWMFYAAADDGMQDWRNHTEKYLGIGWKIDTDTGIKVQRFNNSGTRPGSALSNGITGVGDWMHVAAVFHVDGIDLYINGEFAATVGSSYKLADILGENPVIYLGRANYEGGEYGNSTLDCLKIYNYSLSDEAIADLYEKDMGDDKYVPPAPIDPGEPALIYELDFEDNLDLTTGTTPAVAHGNITYGAGYKGKAVRINGNGNYIEIANAPIALLEEFTVSFALKVDSVGAWPFFAAPDAEPQKNNYEKYLGMHKANDGYLDFERFNSNGSRADHAWAGYALNTWKHFTVVYGKTYTAIYIDGVLDQVKEHTESLDLIDILGRTPVIQLGKANWNSGEYSNMWMDCFKLHNFALNADQVTALYNSIKA